MSSPNVLIAFYSRSGVTERLAGAIAEGAKRAGAEVRIRRAREVASPEAMARAAGWAESAAAMNQRHEAPTEADAEWADAIAFGSPTRFGSIASELKAYIDSLGGLWYRGGMVGKAGAAFTTTSTTHGGNETTILSLYPVMAHLGLIIVPTGYADAVHFRAGTPYGASAISFNEGRLPTEDDIQAAHLHGERLAKVAAALKAAKA